MVDAAESAAPPPPKPGEVRVDIGALNGSEQDAGEALTGLFEEENTGIQAQDESQAQDTEQAEKPAIGDTENGHSEPSETGAIEPPVSWTAEEKKLFQELPPNLQQTVLRRESERDKLVSTQGQKAIEEAKALETLRTQIANERAQHTQLLQAALLQLNPDLQRFNNIDWAKLAAEKPAEWAQQRQAYEDVMQRANAAQAYIGVIQQQQQADQQQRDKEFMATEQQKLIAALPDFADPVKGKALAKDIADHLTEIKPDEWGAIKDHRYLLVARDAMLWRKSQAARVSAQTKKQPPAQSNVRTLRPTARQPGAGEEAQQKQVQALHANLRKTGSTRDAADILVAAGLFGKG